MGEAEEPPGFALSDLTFRPAQAADRDVILRACRATHADHHARQPDFFDTDPENHDGFRMLDQALASLRRGQSFDGIIVAVQGEAVVGYVFVALVGKGQIADWFADIADIWVHPDWRGRGVAGALRDRAVGYAQASGASKICATVWADNPASDAVFARPPFAFANRKYRAAFDKAAPAKPRNTFLRLWDHSVFAVTVIALTAVAFLAVYGFWALVLQ